MCCNVGIYNQLIIIHAAGDDNGLLNPILKSEVEFISIAMLTNDILKAHLTGPALVKSDGFQDS
jgi:hypothetical protein